MTVLPETIKRAAIDQWRRLGVFFLCLYTVVTFLPTYLATRAIGIHAGARVVFAFTVTLNLVFLLWTDRHKKAVNAAIEDFNTARRAQNKILPTAKPLKYKKYTAFDPKYNMRALEYNAEISVYNERHGCPALDFRNLEE